MSLKETWIWFLTTKGLSQVYWVRVSTSLWLTCISRAENARSVRPDRHGRAAGVFDGGDGLQLPGLLHNLGAEGVEEEGIGYQQSQDSFTSGRALQCEEYQAGEMNCEQIKGKSMFSVAGSSSRFDQELLGRGSAHSVLIRSLEWCRRTRTSHSAFLQTQGKFWMQSRIWMAFSKPRFLSANKYA